MAGDVGVVIDVVGIGADGWEDLPARLRELVAGSDVVLGGARHLEMLAAADSLPETATRASRPTSQQRLAWPSPLRSGLPVLLDSLPAGATVTVLASGDPMVSGIGTTLVELLGAERVRVHPAVSSVSLARAELGWAAESCAVVSVVGRDVTRVNRELAPRRRVLVLSSDEGTPGAIAELLVAAGYGASTMHVLGNLGSEVQTHQTGVADGWQQTSPRLNIVALELEGPSRGGWTAGLADELFSPLVPLPRDERAVALARLAPVPGEELWSDDASVAIEWMRCHPSCTATVVGADEMSVGRAARAVGVPGLVCVADLTALAGLPSPDAVFRRSGAQGWPVMPGARQVEWG